MPWNIADATRHNKKLNARQRRVWARVANSVLKRTGHEGQAIRQANAVSDRTKARVIQGATKQHAGVMIAFPIPPGYAARLALSIGQVPFGSSVLPSEQLHLTLCHPGDSADLAPYKNAIIAAVAEFASIAPPIEAKIGGVGRFAKDEGGKNAFYAQIDSLDIQLWRMALVRCIQRILPDYHDHYGFTPHITLAYIPSRIASPAIMPEPLEMVFDSVILAWGDETTVFPLAEMVATKAQSGTGSGGGKGYGARKGEVIVGNLARDEGGKFVAAGNAPAASTPTASKPKTKPVAGYRPPQKASTKKPAAAKKSPVNAAQREAERQRTRAKREAERLADRAKRETERQADRAKRAAEQEADRKKKADAKLPNAATPPKGGAGGEGKQTAADKRKQQQADNRKRTIAEMESKGGLSSKLAESLIDLFEGDSPNEADLEALVAEGVAKKTAEGAYILSPAGVTYVRSLNKGNAEAATRALERARKSRASKKEHSPGFAVFKGANGQYRWVLYSSNAYRDRDGEIISEAALKEECARSDRDGIYGPLRWWHVGEPDPIKHPEAPWGPGADLGMCDFRAMRGRVLVESGTFKSERIGEAVGLLQDDLRGSIGLLHPFNEPTPEDGASVFRNIYIFERSLLPAGKESNPFTRVYVYDERKRKMEQKKLEMLRALVGESVASEILSGADATQKEAEGAGVLYKETQPTSQVDAILAAFTTALKAALLPAQPEASVVAETEKATTEAAAVEASAKADEEEMIEEVVESESEEVYVADMTMTEFRDMLASAFQEAVAPLVDMETKMRGLGDGMKGNAALLEDLKAALGLTRKKEAETASAHQAQAQEIATLKQSLQQQIADLQKQLADVDTKTKELAGEVPAGFGGFSGFQASTHSSTVAPTAKEVSQYPSQSQAINGFLDNFLGGATNGH